MFWTNGYVYDAKKVLAIDPNAPVDSWAMFFDPEVLSKFTPCGVSILDSPEDVMDLALNYLHLHPGTNDRGGTEAGRRSGRQGAAARRRVR